MHERFPKKKPGQHLTAEQVNDLGFAARQGGLASGGAPNHLYNAGTFSTQSSPLPHHQRVVEVVGTEQIDFPYAVGKYKVQKVYLVQEQYFDRDAGRWLLIDTTGPFPMDHNYMDKEYQIGDVVIAYWDLQRNMYVPICCEETATMWCGYVCECAKREDPADPSSKCCVYRGNVKRLNDVTNICNPGYITKGAWIVADCDLPAHSEGWVRPTGADLELTWTSPSSGITLTETFEVYEWCCWGAVQCPGTDDVMTATFTHPMEDCHNKVSAIGTINCHYVSQQDLRTKYPLADNYVCQYDGWQGEFSVAVTQDVRGIEVVYIKDQEKNSKSQLYTGLVALDPITSEVRRMWDNNFNPIGDISTVKIQETTGLCLNMNDYLAAEGGAKETVTRWYRVRFTCENGSIGNGCIQHLYPPGHPIYKYGQHPFLDDAVYRDLANSDYRPSSSDGTARYLIALEDQDGITNWQEVCNFNFVGAMDILVGDKHIGEGDDRNGARGQLGTDGWRNPVGPVDNFVIGPNFSDSGIEDGAGVAQAWMPASPLDGLYEGQQYSIHTFAGCANDFLDGITCQIDPNVLNIGDVRVVVTWS